MAFLSSSSDCMVGVGMICKCIMEIASDEVFAKNIYWVSTTCQCKE